MNFRDQVSTTDLNKFIDDNLQPTDEFDREMKKSVDKICRFFREHMSPFKIVKVYSYIWMFKFFYCLVSNKKRFVQPSSILLFLRGCY